MFFYGKQSSLKTKLLLHSPLLYPVCLGIWTELKQQRQMLGGGEQKGVISGGSKGRYLREVSGETLWKTEVGQERWRETGTVKEAVENIAVHLIQTGGETRGSSVSLYPGLLDYWPAVKCT